MPIDKIVESLLNDNKESNTEHSIVLDGSKLTRKVVDTINRSIFEGRGVQLLINAKQEDTPVAWDAELDLSVDKKSLMIYGGVDSNGFGKVTIQIPLDHVNNYYEIRYEDNSSDPKIPEVILNARLK